jgi:hypothetical protein
LIKWAHARNVYIVNIILGAKECTSLLYWHFVNLVTRYKINFFKRYLELLEGVTLVKIQIKKAKVKDLVFDIVPVCICVRYNYKLIGALKFVIREVRYLIRHHGL